MTMPTNNDNIKSIGNPSSNGQNSNSISSSNKPSHVFSDYKKRQPNNPYGSSSSLINSQPNNNPNNTLNYEGYRRISASQGTYYGSRNSKSYYYSEENGKRLYNGARSLSQDGAANKQYFGYSNSSSTNKQGVSQQQRNVMGTNKRMSESPSSKPSLSITTANDYDGKPSVDKPVSSGLKTPKSSGYYQSSNYVNGSYSRYQSGGNNSSYGPRKGYYGNGKYGGVTDRPMSAHVNMNSDFANQDSDGPASISSDFDKSGDSYSYYNNNPYNKSNGRHFFNKSGKSSDYYSSPKGVNITNDTFYGNSKYNNYQYTSPGNSNNVSNNQSGNSVSLINNNSYDSYGNGKYPNKFSSYYDEDSKYSPKFNRSQRKYTNWYGSNSHFNSSQQSYFQNHSSQLDDDSSSVHAAAKSFTQKDVSTVDDDENVINNSMVSNAKDENTTSNNDDEDEDEDEYQYNLKKEAEGSSSLLRTQIKHDAIVSNKEHAVEQSSKALDLEKSSTKARQPDDFNLDADIDIHFDDDDEEDLVEEIDEEMSEIKEKRIESPGKDINQEVNISIKQENIPATKKSKSKVMRDPLKLYVKVEEGCVFPLNRLDFMLFQLENRPQEEIVEDQIYLLKNPVTNLKEDYPFFEHNFLIDSQVYRTKLAEIFKKSKRQIYHKMLSLRKKHYLFDEDWQLRCETNEKQLLEMYPQYESQLFDHEESATDINNQSNNSNNRRSRHQIGATSEAEFEKLLHQIQMNDPLYKAEQHAAKIPSMIMNPLEKYGKHFVNVNNLVTEKSIFTNRLKTDPIDNFNKEEVQLFNEAYVAHPKKFGKISALMGGLRTPEECVRHYYNTKRLISYKQLVSNKRNRKNITRKKPTKTRPGNRRTSSSATDIIESPKQITKAVEEKKKIVRQQDIIVKPEKEAKKSDSQKPVDEQAFKYNHTDYNIISSKDIKVNEAPSLAATADSSAAADDMDSTVELSSKHIGDDIVTSNHSKLNQVGGDQDINGATDETLPAIGGPTNERATREHSPNDSEILPKSKISSGAIANVNGNEEPKAFEIADLLSNENNNTHLEKVEKDSFMDSKDVDKPSEVDNSSITNNNLHAFDTNKSEISTKLTQLENERKREVSQIENSNKKGKPIKKRKNEKKKEVSPSDQSKKERKKKTSTMYWSVAETAAFPKILFKYGSQWDLIAKEMGTKSALMVRNFFGKNADKEGWRDEVARIDKKREAESARISDEKQELEAKASETSSVAFPPLGIFNEDRGKIEVKSILVSHQHGRPPEILPSHSENYPSVLTSKIGTKDSSIFMNASKPVLSKRTEPKKANINSLINQNIAASPKISISSMINENTSSLARSSNSRVFVSNLISGPSHYSQSSNTIERSGTPARTPISNLINSSPGSSIVRPPSAKPNIMNLLNNSPVSDNQGSSFYRHDSTLNNRTIAPNNTYPNCAGGVPNSNLMAYASTSANNSSNNYSDSGYLGHQYNVQRQPFHSSFMHNLHSNNSSASNNSGIRLPSLLNKGSSFTSTHHHTTSSFDSLIAAANREREQQQQQQQQQQQHNQVQMSQQIASDYYKSQSVYGNNDRYYSNNVDSKKQ